MTLDDLKSKELKEKYDKFGPEIVRLTNEFRKKLKKSPVIYEPKIEKICREHSKKMG